MVRDKRALGDEYGRRAVWAAAARERGVGYGLTAVAGHDGVDALGFVQHGAEVFEVFKLGVCGGGGADVLGDFGPEVREDGWVAQEFEEEVGEEGGGGVAAC